MNSTPNCLVTVIIPTRDRPRQLARLLASLARQTGTLVQAVVVDSSSESVLSAISPQVRLVRLVGNRSLARNKGSELSTSDWLLFLDSDMELSDGTVSMCLQDANGYDALILKEITVAGGFFSRARSIERDALFHTGIAEAPRLIRRRVFSAIGGYNQALEGGEDLDLCARLYEAGFRIGWSQAVVYHHEEDLSPIEYLRKRVFYGRFDTVVSAGHPSYWRELASPPRRFALILNTWKKDPTGESTVLVLALITLRALELLGRMISATIGGQPHAPDMRSLT